MRRENWVFGGIESNLRSSLSTSRGGFPLNTTYLSLWCIVPGESSFLYLTEEALVGFQYLLIWGCGDFLCLFSAWAVSLRGD